MRHETEKQSAGKTITVETNKENNKDIKPWSVNVAETAMLCVCVVIYLIYFFVKFYVLHL